MSKQKWKKALETKVEGCYYYKDYTSDKIEIKAIKNVLDEKFPEQKYTIGEYTDYNEIQFVNPSHELLSEVSICTDFQMKDCSLRHLEKRKI